MFALPERAAVLAVSLTPPYSLTSGANLLSEQGVSAHFHGTLGIEVAVKLDDLCHEPGPAGLVTGAQPSAIVAMKVFKEVDVVAPEWITLELFRAAIDRPPTMFIAQEDANETVEISLLTPKRFMSFPDPVGHSILKLSP